MAETGTWKDLQRAATLAIEERDWEKADDLIRRAVKADDRPLPGWKLDRKK